MQLWEEIIGMSFKSGETFSCFVSNFYCHIQHDKEMIDQFTSKLQVLSKKEMSERRKQKNH